MHVFELGQHHQIGQHYLVELRDKTYQQHRLTFRQNLKRLGMLLAYEASKTLSYNAITTETVLGHCQGQTLTQQPLLITVLRAGLPFYEGFLEVFDHADSGFIGAYRVEGDQATTSSSQQHVAVDMHYQACPSLAGRDVFIIDPMLATGSSLVKALAQLPQVAQAKSIHIAAAIAAPEGVSHLQQCLDAINVPSFLWLGAQDSHLNDKAYIVPGLGDAGDLCYGSKL